MLRWIAVALACSWISLAAEAAEFTGASLLAMCRSEDPIEQGFCHGFFRGHSDTHSIFMAMNRGLALYCVPDGVTVSDAERLVFLWMEEHLDLLGEPALVLVMQALREEFPCSPGGEPRSEPPPAPKEE